MHTRPSVLLLVILAGALLIQPNTAVARNDSYQVTIQNGVSVAAMTVKCGGGNQEWSFAESRTLSYTFSSNN